MISAVAECDTVCEQIHLPVQSGSSKILKAMRRTYDQPRYLALVEKLRGAIPGVALGTDVIVGFPGETEEDFEQTLDVVEHVRYDSAFTSSTRRDTVPRRPRCPTRCRTRSSMSGSSASSRWCNGSPPRRTSSASARWRRCSSREERDGRAVAAGTHASQHHRQLRRRRCARRAGRCPDRGLNVDDTARCAADGGRRVQPADRKLRPDRDQSCPPPAAGRA